VPIRCVHIEHYRSIRALSLDLAQVTVVVGANGSGKSNLYRALRLLHAGAVGRLAEAFAEEGGMPSALYAGPKRRDELREVRLIVGVELDDFSYRLACGLPLPGPSQFSRDPMVKEEDLGAIISGRKRPVPICERRGAVITVRDEGGSRELLTDPLDCSESMLSQLADPRHHPELALLRLLLGGWRFYHQFRTDAEAPVRMPRVAVRSPILSHDGANLAAVLQTIRELEHESGQLEAAISSAFPGCALEIRCDDRGLMAIEWRQAGIIRNLQARELSDGTLRFLCLAAALLTPRPPGLMVLNEPESSLHPSLLPALAGLISTAGERSQVLITTHASELASRVCGLSGSSPVGLVLRDGQTSLEREDRRLL
jgi:predicted ATPase